MTNWEQKHIHQFVAGMVFLSAFFAFAVELTDWVAATQTEIDSYGLAPQVKGAKYEKKLVNLAKKTAAPLQKETYEKGELFVRYKKGKKIVPLSPKSANYRVTEKIDERSAIFSGAETNDIFTGMRKLESDPNVEYAQPNFRYAQYQFDTNDPYREKLWGLENGGQNVNGSKGQADADIDAPEAWNKASEKRDVVVAVIDTGVAYDHPDLSSSMWNGENCVDWEGNALGGCRHGYDFSADDKDPFPDESAHGTMVAGVIGAERNNGKGVAGLATRAKIMALKTDFTTGSIVKAIKFAKKNGAEIVNASWGANVGSCENLFDRALYDEIKNFPGFVVAAAGNSSREHDGRKNFFYPADFGGDTACWKALPNLISVAASDQNDRLASFSDFGKLVDVGAPGENIVTTYANLSPSSGDENGKGEYYAVANGTSLAAPYVSALASLLLSENDKRKNEEVKSLIFDCSEPVAFSQKISGGRINALLSVESSSAGKCGETGSLERLAVLNGETAETVNVPVARISLANAEEAKFFRLSKNGKKIKKARWREMPGEILVRIAKKRKNQNFYLQFRDASGNASVVFRKIFKYKNP